MLKAGARKIPHAWAFSWAITAVTSSSQTANTLALFNLGRISIAFLPYKPISIALVVIGHRNLGICGPSTETVGFLRLGSSNQQPIASG
jgi:hypothetical protein